MLHDPNFARQVIMDHYENPRNKRSDAKYKFKRMDSDSCIDDVTIYMDIQDDVVEDISFEGTGCTISVASTSMMTELLKGKTVDEVRLLSAEYIKMIRLEDYDEEKLQESVVFRNVGRQANRVNCATLGWRGVNAILNEREESHESRKDQ